MSGLLVPLDSYEAATRDALKRYDSDLRLVPQDSDYFGRRVYKVFRYRGSEQPADFVCGWWDEHGYPYESLSIDGLLDMVKRLDRNTSWVNLDPDVRNAELREQREREANQGFDEIADEFRAKLDGKKSSPLPRSRSLYQARNRVRARTQTNEIKP